MRLVLYESLPQVPDNRVQPGILEGDTVVSMGPNSTAPAARAAQQG